jgi:hypothetical protein
MVTRLATKDAANRSQAERAGFAAFFDYIDQHRHLYRVVRQAEFVDPEIFRAYYRAFAEGYQAILAEAMDREEIARCDPEVLAYCLMGIGDFVGMRWVLWDGTSIAPHVFEATMQFIQYGLTAPEHREVRERRSDRTISVIVRFNHTMNFWEEHRSMKTLRLPRIFWRSPSPSRSWCKA